MSLSTALVFGKFMPLHQGHIAMIDFAANHCERVIVLVCAQDFEPIPGPQRLQWVQQTFKNHPKVMVEYTEVQLPYSSESSRSISEIWSRYFTERYGNQITHVVTSEKYGDYVAEYMDIRHVLFDPQRRQQPVSATLIRQNPFTHWKYIAQAARPYFARKVCLYGPESVGKSTMTVQLAEHFQTCYAQEMGRILVQDSTDCSIEDIRKIPEAHAKEIQLQLLNANKVLFCDTDLHTTRVYARYMFGHTLDVKDWIEQVNQYDLYLFLDTDVPFVQDGTRLGAHCREELKRLFIKQLEAHEIPYHWIRGNWDQRFEQAVALVKEKILEVH
ncbi:AAA family ATPase [Rapidithrix thailandica]|uniref:AAA family ATPase n=1 Tax=Rapidithrix thailandica TaxID=413964 RepID=A0AAW9S1N4_9BACT